MPDFVCLDALKATPPLIEVMVGEIIEEKYILKVTCKEEMDKKAKCQKNMKSRIILRVFSMFFWPPFHDFALFRVHLSLMFHNFLYKMMM
jgi:hypothetical protein